MLKHLRARFPVLAGFALIAVGIFVGEYFSLYYRIPQFDKILHTTGGFVAAWFVLALLQEELTHMRWWKQLFLVVSAAAFIGVVWEWAEFLAGLSRTSMPTLYHYFHGGDLADTIGDLVADTAGALALSVWALWKERAK